MDNQDSSQAILEKVSVKHCDYCSEGYDGKCDGVSVEQTTALLGTIESQKQTHDALPKKILALEARNKELEADKDKLLAERDIANVIICKHCKHGNILKRCEMCDRPISCTDSPSQQ